MDFQRVDKVALSISRVSRTRDSKRHHNSIYHFHSIPQPPSQFHCLASAFSSATRVLRSSLLACANVSTCVCRFCAASLSPSLPFGCPLFARSYPNVSTSSHLLAVYRVPPQPARRPHADPRLLLPRCRCLLLRPCAPDRRLSPEVSRRGRGSGRGRSSLGRGAGARSRRCALVWRRRRPLIPSRTLNPLCDLLGVRYMYRDRRR